MLYFGPLNLLFMWCDGFVSISYRAMQMHQQWMYNADRRSKEFIDGLHHFLDVAKANKQNGFICCLCI
jgi:hypothetical protein